MRCRFGSTTGLSLIETVTVLFIVGVLTTAIILPLSRRARDERVLLLKIEEVMRSLHPGDCYTVDNDRKLHVTHDHLNRMETIRLRTIEVQGSRSACLGESGRGLYQVGSGWASTGTCFRGTTTASNIRVCINSYGVVYRFTPGM